MKLLNHKDTCIRCIRAVAGALLLFAALPGIVFAGDIAMPGVLSTGDAVVTGFPGVLPPPEDIPPEADPLAYVFIDPDGPSMQINRLLPAGPPSGQLIDAPALVSVPARDVGQVFAVTLDDAPAPNIYLGATSAFGIHIVAPGDDGTPRHVKQGTPGAQFMQGQWGTGKGGAPGSIYKVDGITGAVTLFSSIGTNAGPGLGDVVFDRASRQFFVSDLDTGLIYRLDSTGLISDTFDHGVSARPSQGLASVADDGSRMDIANPAFNSEEASTWGLTPLGRRVGGMAVYGGRLFYAVAEGPQVWSVGISLDGSFRGDARWELDVSGPASSDPVTDITFDSAGRMILAQRGAQSGSFDYSVFAQPKTATVIRYTREIPDDPATPGIWVPVPDEYAIGFRPQQRNTNGGVALGYGFDNEGLMRLGSCNAFLWTTGEALRDDADLADRLVAGGPAIVDGLQGNDAALVKPENSPPFSSYFTDYDGDFDHPERQGWMGDVEVYQPCTGTQGVGYLPPMQLPPGELPPGGSFNLTLDKEAAPRVCLPGGLGWICYYTIRVTNTGSEPYWGPLTVRDWMPAAVPGSIMNFDFQPPWICAELGSSDHECTLPGVFLMPGDSVDLYVTDERPAVLARAGSRLPEQYCYAGNTAGLVWWDDYGDANPDDDFDYAEAQIPDENCAPRGDRTNLTITKEALKKQCSLSGGTWHCSFLITVTNTGPGVYSGPIEISEEVSVPGTIAYGPQPNPPAWNCVPAGGTSYTCNHAPVTLNPGQSVDLWFKVKVPVAQQEADGKCSIENRVRITRAPGGSAGNFDPADDGAEAQSLTLGSNCGPSMGKKSDLSLKKEARRCIFRQDLGGYACGFIVTVKNEGPNSFNGVLTVKDQPSPAIAGSPVFFGPWDCAPSGGGFDCTLKPAALPLPPGASRHLAAFTLVPINSKICEIRNEASILAPAGGTNANSNPANDESAIVTLPVPSPECERQRAPDSNLVISKTPLRCEGGQSLTAAVAVASGVTCRYQVTVSNMGPGAVTVPVTILDTPDLPATTVATTADPGWACSSFGALAGCRSVTGMPAGATANFEVDVQTTMAAVRQSGCRIRNQAWIAEPIGAPRNIIAADDVAEATADGPPELCPAMKPLNVQSCPVERQMPDQGCCPEGERWNGRACSGESTAKACPTGTTGKYPNCTPVVRQVCPKGTTGKYPKCTPTVRQVCPQGTIGKWPNCEKPREKPRKCPQGTTGKYPNCVPIVKQVCPKGTIGKWPNCVPIVKQVCPKGTIGKWPNCEKPRKCPRGTTGRYPDCVPIIKQVCPEGTVGTWPNCKRERKREQCRKGYVYSRSLKTCIPVEQQVPEKQILKKAPINISPELLMKPDTKLEIQ
jgi:hypothetical protein